MDDLRRRVPRTDAVLADPRLLAAERRLGRPAVLAAVRAAQDQIRTGGGTDASASTPTPTPTPTPVADLAVARLPASATSLRPVLNATGVVLHTNLGRAPLSAAAVEALTRAAGYVDVEFCLDTGRRAGRGRGALAALSAALPDAGAVLVVNNGAAALLLAVTALAGGREVLWSRGEMVEIGDGFRLPDLVASAGAVIREVGTTNRTSAEDYAGALSERTGCLLKVHPSNFTVRGFTCAPSVRQLAALGPPVVVDVGSGLLAPDPLLPTEPDMASALRAGAAVVTASGDKLLGGPQAGLLAGSAPVIAQLRRHPLARALRADKLTLAALEATLAGPRPPAWQALHVPAEALRDRAEALAARLGPPARVVTTAGAVGGGAAPDLALPGAGVALPERLCDPLRTGTPPVVARRDGGSCVLDLRCIPPECDDALLEAVRACM